MAYYLILLLLLVVYKVNLLETCTRGSECPPHKPFCSSLGCLNKCPEPFYKNNTDCVLNCMDWFVENDRTCVNECRPTDFIEETLKLSLGPFIERKCVSECHKYTYNKTCVDMSPIENQLLHVGGYNRDSYGNVYAINGNKICVDHCPDSYPFKQNTTYNGESLTICTSECYKYIEKGYCVNSCTNGSAIFNNTCVSSCHQPQPIANKDGVCTELCIPTNVKDSMCACPETEPFVLNNTCVDECGAYIFHRYLNEKVFCIEKCNDSEVIHNRSCIRECPRGTFKLLNECLNECPESSPHYCALNAHGICDDAYFLFSCFDHCPVGLFVDRFACKHNCPYFTLNTTCHDKCPNTHPFIYNNVTGIGCEYEHCSDIIRHNNCLDDCPVGYFKRRNKCTSVCGNNEFVFNGSCLTECPYEMHSREFHIAYKELRPNSYRWYELKTISQLTNKCVDRCESTEYQYNNTCVTSCPGDLPFAANGICSVGPCMTNYYYNMTTFVRCVDACDDSDFILDKECLNVCPNSTFALKNHCMNVCSNKTFMTNNVKTKCENPESGCPEHLLHIYTSCVDTCPNGTYILNNSCIDYCPKNYVAKDMNCLEFCPNNMRYRIKITETIFVWKFTYMWFYDLTLIRQTKCSKICPVDHFKRRDECNLFCTSNEYVYNGTCYTECPKQMMSRKFTLEYLELEENERYSWIIKNVTKSQLTNKCVDACESNEYQYKNTCVTACTDDLPYASKGICGIGPCTTKYYYNMTTFIRCVVACDDNDFIRDNECLFVCPNTTFAHDAQCVSGCPSKSFFHKVVRTKCGNNCHYLPESSLHRYIRCIENCPNGTYVFNVSCVDYCPENYVRAHGSCLKECPNHLPYKNETVVQINKWTSSYRGWDLVQQNKHHQECVSDCKIRGRPLDLETSHCVASCPPTYHYVEDNVCRSNCSNNVVTNEESFGIECVKTCPNDKFFYNNTCVTKCTDEAKYEYKGFCFKTCPSESPFGVTQQYRNLCIKQCEDSKLFLNGECVYSSDCKRPMFEFQGQCLPQCPSGYVYSLSQGCLNVANVRTAIIVIFVTLACIFLYCWNIIRDCVWISYFSRTLSKTETFPKLPKRSDQHQVEFENFAFDTSETEVEGRETLL